MREFLEDHPLFRWLLLIPLLALLLFGGGTVALHTMQKAHNELPLSVEERYPWGQPVNSGEAFAATLVALMKRELNDGFGWRPNDIFLWGPWIGPDNNANRQMGIIQAVRESTRVFRDHLTKVSSREYDPNLMEAENLFRNDATKWIWPSAEGRYKRAVKHLERYIEGLETGESEPLNRRNVELIRLFQQWTDLLGGAYANLERRTEASGDPVPGHKIDDYFYQAQGMSHAMFHLLTAVKREYYAELQNRGTVIELIDEVLEALGRAGSLKPLIVFEGEPDGIFANHRANLSVSLAEARQKMYSIREELEK